MTNCSDAGGWAGADAGGCTEREIATAFNEGLAMTEGARGGAYDVAYWIMPKRLFCFVILRK